MSDGLFVIIIFGIIVVILFVAWFAFSYGFDRGWEECDKVHRELSPLERIRRE